jgi:hypothetical protein
VLKGALVSIFLVFVAGSSGAAPASSPAAQPGGHQQPATNPTQDNLAIDLGRWIGVHHNAIEAGSAAATVIFTFVLAVSTIGLWRSTRRLWRGAEAQARDFKQSIAEAERAATAMEGVSKAMGENVKHVAATVATNKQIADRQKRLGELQLRAYVSVLIGGCRYQDRSANLRFDTSPVLLNTGHTAALNLKYRIAAAILPIPVPQRFRFPLPKEVEGSSLLAPQQNATITAVVSDFVDDQYVEQIKRADRFALYTWGLITYEDVFRRLHRVTFAQQLYWTPSGPITQNWDVPQTIRGWYLGRHNKTS